MCAVLQPTFFFFKDETTRYAERGEQRYSLAKLCLQMETGPDTHGCPLGRWLDGRPVRARGALAASCVQRCANFRIVCVIPRAPLRLRCGCAAALRVADGRRASSLRR